MSNGLFFLIEEDLANIEFIEEILRLKFKNLSTLSLLFDDENFMSEDDFINLIIKNGEKNTKLNILKQYENLSKESDFVLVIAEKNSFNISLAKDLNLPILTQYSKNIDIKFDEYKFKSLKAKRFAYIYENKIFFECSKKIVSFDILEVKPEIFTNELKDPNFKTPLNFEYNLFKKASSNLKTVVLPESQDERILKAASILAESKAVNLIILGDEKEVKEKALNLGLNLYETTIINPQNSEFLDEFANEFFLLRKHKGVNLEQAKEIVKDRNYFGTMLVLLGKADAMVSGAVGTTADTIRPALQVIKTKDGVNSVSGAFIMCLDGEILVFADCAIIPNPTAKDLAGVAISSFETAKNFGIEPKIAMLSYSTGKSGSGESVNLVKEATNLAKEKLGDIVDGPLQFDASIDKIVANKKMPNSKVAGNANVFIFPDLNSGNITYKAVQRLAGAVAMGPILQGLKKPVNDLSRGALVDDIVNTVLISAIQAGE